MAPLPDIAAATPGALPPARFGLRLRVRALRARTRRRVRLEGRVYVGRGVVLEAGPAGRIVLGDGCVIGDGSRLLAREGEIAVGAGSVLGERCVLVAHAGISLGRSCLVGDRALIVDFDHRFEEAERPIRLQGLSAAPVQVGDGARIGHEAALLRGVQVGAGAAVGAHAIVTRDVAAGALATGMPARSGRFRPGRPALS